MGDKRAISLFTGAGGLDIGLEAAGFRSTICVENDPAARSTLRKNRQDWRLMPKDESDILTTDPKTILYYSGLKPGEPELVVGGPPCQPFSKARLWASQGKTRLNDPRSETLGRFLDVVNYALPRVVLMENVPGIRRRNAEDGLPLIEKRFKEINQARGACYRPVAIQLDAADYGVPQHRARLFVIAHREGEEFHLPRPRYGVINDDKDSQDCPGEVYRTAWDAIGDFDFDADEFSEDLGLRGKYREFVQSIPEGSNYLWHTPEGIERWSKGRRSPADAYWGWRTRYWSFLLKLAKSKPSWTISATPGPSTGPFHWRNRLLSVRELCRLQTFPDDYEIEGASRREKVRQIGNAVPCAIGELLGLEIRRQLLGDQTACHSSLTLVPGKRGACPEPEPVRPVPAAYDYMRARHPPHAGEGLGPGAGRGQA